MNSIRVTLDTSVLDATTVVRLEQSAVGLQIEFSCVTVSDRETAGTSIQSVFERILETGVWDESKWGNFRWGGFVRETFALGESPLGEAILGGDDEPDLFESLLKMISNGAFPRQGARDHLSQGQQHQLRDAMILHAHAREQRDILVTEDRRGFIGRDGSLWKKLESRCRTRIMNVAEFYAHCRELRRRGTSSLDRHRLPPETASTGDA